jgi:hypothetical protein
MNLKYFIPGIIILMIMMTGCEDSWKDRLDSIPETVDKNVWEVIQQDPELSEFVRYIKEMKYDTLFLTNDPYTLFAPTNQAFSEFTEDITTSVLDYHISLHFIQSGSVRGKQKIQTLAEKFALLDHSGGNLKFDEGSITFESPLYRNGKYFKMTKVGYPRPNIYEFFAINNPVLKDYIDGLDSIIVDMEKSRPIGFDEEGNVIYDTVAIIYNEFEETFFPVRKEFRNRTATMVFPRLEEYNQALTGMAQYIEAYNDYTDIPVKWQHDILIPWLMENGVFENMIDEVVFRTPTKRDTIKMKNIIGDSIVIDYDVTDRVIASNGFIYGYKSFKVPDTLYLGATNFEAEDLLREIGVNRYAWRESVRVITDIAQPSPMRDYNLNASNDSLIRVMFPPTNLPTRYSLEFIVDNLFPRKYLMVVGTNINIGGIWDIYVNDEHVRRFTNPNTMNWNEYQVQQGVIWSVTRRWRYFPKATYNKFDAFIDNRAEYGTMKVRFEWVGPGNVLHKGLVIDNLYFIPYDF